MSPIVEKVLADYGLLTAFALVGLTMAFAYWASDKLTRGRLHGSAIAILVGLILAAAVGGKKGVADLPVLAGVGLMGGAMLRDLAIVATAFGVKLEEFAKSGVIGAVSLLTGLFISFFVGGLIAYAFGYRDAVSITTIGAGAATYIVGGLVKAILVMVLTPFLAKPIGLDNPRSAMVFGGLMGTNSGVMAALAATDPKLVPYGAMTATFFTGLGCLLGPSLVFMINRALF